MSSTAEAVARPHLTIDPRAATFFCGVLVASFSPWLLGALLQSVRLADAIAVFSVAHVGMTGFFWIDRRYSAHIASRPRIFYLAPAIVAAVSLGATISLGEP